MHIDNNYDNHKLYEEDLMGGSNMHETPHDSLDADKHMHSWSS